MPQNRVRRFLITLVLLAASLALLSGTAGASPPDPDSPDCWVRNTSTGVVGSDLQAAIRDADPGVRLRLRGTCHGGFQFSEDIILHGPATLSAEQCYEGYCFAADIVADVYSANVKFKDLVITDGYSTHMGGGIYNSGNLTLSNTAVRGNWAEDGGGGIFNEGTVRLNRSSSVTDSYLLYGDGGGILNHGTLILNGRSRVERNEATRGGGIYSDGRVVLNHRATVTANSAWDGEDGGGLLNEGGSVWFSPRWRGTLCGNSPDDWPTC